MKTCRVELDEYTQKISTAFDYEFDGESHFDEYSKPDVPEDFQIGVIVGSSGSGKTTLLNEFGVDSQNEWQENKAIVSHFDTPNEAINKLTSVGLNSIPAWVKPYHVLSTGEKFRADLARKLKPNSVIDEFTSVVDRNVAKATSVSISKHIRNTGLKGIVLATCHFDILEWLEPDWVFNTDSGLLSVGRYLRRPKINIEIRKSNKEMWRIFGKHHYLSNSLNNSAHCYVGIWNGVPVVFTAVIAYPSGTVKNAWREHRTVVLPDYQGMGIGTRFSDAIAKLYVDDGKRYYSRTAHIRMGEYREKSPLWKPTSKNKVVRKDINKKTSIYNSWKGDQRVTYSHEYIGAQ